MTISTLPTPPSRADAPETFANRADALLGALPTFVTETNATATAINADKLAAQSAASAAAGSASDAADQVGLAEDQVSMATAHANDAAASAASAINAPGTSAFSTQSLTIGLGTKAFSIQTGKAFAVGQFVILASAANPGNYMVGQITAHNATTGAVTLNATATGGTGTYSDWNMALTAPADAASAAGGYESIVAGVSTTLSTTAKRVLAVNFVADNLSLTLPDARALPLGELYVIENTGAFKFAVRDSAGTLRSIILPGQIAALYLKYKGTAAGSWAFGTLRGGTGQRSFLGTGTSLTLSPANNDASASMFVMLTETTGILLWRYTATCYRAVVTITNGVISVGTVVSTTNAPFSSVGGSSRLIRLSDTQALFVAGHVVATLTVSGSTITLGAAATAGVSSIAGGSLVRLTDTSAFLCFRSASTHITTCYVVSVSGTTCTFGTVYQYSDGGVSSGATHAVALESTKVLVTAATTSSDARSVLSLTISGTTITYLSACTYADNGLDANNSPMGLIRIDATSALLLSYEYIATATNSQKNRFLRAQVVTHGTSTTSKVLDPVFYPHAININNNYTRAVEVADGVALICTETVGDLGENVKRLLEVSHDRGQISFREAGGIQTYGLSVQHPVASRIGEMCYLGCPLSTTNYLVYPIEVA